VDPLLLLCALPLTAALALALPLRAGHPRLARALALAAAALTLGLLLDLLRAPPSPLRHPWIPHLGLDLHLRLDPLTAPLLLLLALLTPAALLLAARARLPALLLAQAHLSLLLLAADLGLFAAAAALLPLLALLLAGRERPAGLFVPLHLGAAALTLAVLLLALAHHDAAEGAWSFALHDLSAIALPPPLEALVFALLVAAGWLILGLWPVHGWWRQAGEGGEAAAALILLAAVRPVGLLILLHAVTLAPTAAAAAAPHLNLLALAGLLIGLLAALGDPDPHRRTLHLTHPAAALALIGLFTATAEGLSGALLLTYGAGLALAHRLTTSTASPTPTASSTLTGAAIAGLALAPGLVLVLISGFGAGSLSRTNTRLILLVALLALVLTAHLLARPRQRPSSPRPPLSTLAGPPLSALARPLHLALALLILLFGLHPAPLTTHLGAAATAAVRRLTATRCAAEHSPTERPRRLLIPPECAPGRPSPPSKP
jgi:NADH-quinone oxidoreductase subunit M